MNHDMFNTHKLISFDKVPFFYLIIFHPIYRFNIHHILYIRISAKMKAIRMLNV